MMHSSPGIREGAPPSPYVDTVEELHEIVAAVQAEGEFAFDVETRGNIARHADVTELIETEWEAKLATLKSDHPTTLARSRSAIEERWTKELALDPLRNEVFWISIATSGKSWAIPMGHPNGEILVPEERGDGSTVPPEGHRAILASGNESKAKAKYFIPAVFTDPPEQLSQGEVFSVLEPLFSDESIVKINQNIKFDAKSVTKYLGGELPQGTYIDTMVLMHLLNENMQSFSLGKIIDEVFDFDPYWRDGKLGATITTEAFSKACRYAHYDARWAWLVYKRLHRLLTRSPSLTRALHVELPVLRPIAQMEMNGIAVNQREMKNLGRDLEMKINTILADMSPYIWPGFNPDSVRDKGRLLYGKKSEGGLGLKGSKKTQTGYSTDAESLGKLKGKHPIVDMLLEYNETVKLKGTFVDGLVPKLNRGRLHPNFNLHRTDTGRLSCVSGDTLLPTSRGTFRFDEYLPMEGDTVLTHLGNRMPVLRKVYKGVDEMLLVTLDNGSSLKCTAEHRLLTSNEEWVRVGELSPGSEVVTSVSIEELHPKQKQCTESASPVSERSPQAGSAGNSRRDEYHLRQRTGSGREARFQREEDGREEASVSTFQARPPQPYVGQEWFPASQLRGSGVGRTRVPAEEGEREVYVRAPQGDGRGVGYSYSAPESDSAPSRRGQAQQLSGQPSIDDRLRSPATARIAEIQKVGYDGVWDIEVAEDSSYVTRGFVNHNSSGPNLQNIPSDAKVRRLFQAAPGESLIVADYGQIEMRVFCMFSQDAELHRIFREGIDIHTGTAAVMFGLDPSEVDAKQRILGKAQPLTSSVLTPTGYRPLGDLQVGDLVVDPATGGFAPIVGVHPQGVRDVARVSFSDGSSVRCDYEHLWATSRKGKRIEDIEGVSSLNKIVETTQGVRTDSVRVPLTEPVQFPHRELLVDPYIVGVLLGDGGISDAGVTFSSGDEFIPREVARLCPRHWDVQQVGSSSIGFSITQGNHRGPRGRHAFSPQSALRDVGLMGHGFDTKFVPETYLYSSVEQRTAILQGIMDTDGSVSSKAGDFCSGSRQLAEDVRFLASSLGCKVTTVSERTTESGNPGYRVRISSVPRSLSIFRLERKSVKMGIDTGHPKTIVSVKADGREPVQCISVGSASHLYITDGMTVTHNTANFLMGYGGTAKRLFHSVGGLITLEEAEAAVDGYNNGYAGMTAWKAKAIRQARKKGYAETRGGRRRRLPGLNSEDFFDRMRAERQCINAIIQGTASEICKDAMVKVDAMLDYPSCKMLVQVHDELVVSVPSEETRLWIPRVEEAMGNGNVIDGVELEVEAHSALSWADAKAG